MRFIRGNVEREADGVEAERLLKKGFKQIEGAAEPAPSAESKKELKDMTAEELRELAKEKGMSGVASLSKKDLMDILKG